MEILDSNRVRVHFTNGNTAEGDLLVAADGINSAIRKQLLPETCEPTKFGIIGVAGKVFLDAPKIPEYVQQLKHGVCAIMSSEGRGMFLASQLYSDEAKAQITELFRGTVDGVTHESQLSPNAMGDDLILVGGSDIAKKPLVDDARDYMFWGYLTKYPEDFGIGDNGSMKNISQQNLLDRTVAVLKNKKWSSGLVQMVQNTDVNTIGYWPLHMAPNITSLSPYKPSNVTFIGDSIHASMSYFILY